MRMRSPLAVSLAAHALAFIALMYAPTLRLPEPGKSEYKQAIAGKEPKLIWYKLNKELPQVAAKPARTPARAETVAKQEIISTPKLAPRRTQIVWTPAPELQPTPPVALPNLLAVKLPPVRQFVAPPDIRKPVAAIEVPTDAPAATARSVRTFLPPPDIRKPLAPVELAADAPAVTAKVVNKFLPPPVRPAPPSPQLATPDAAPDLNIAVVGLNPIDKLVPFPVAPSPALFSAAPEIRKQGADSTGDGRGLTVPDLSIRGKLLAEAYASPTSRLTMREAMRLTQPALVSAPAPLPAPAKTGGAMKVSGAPDARFNNRDVYMMAIQMPNLTSSSGSWLMWYADRNAKKLGLAPVAPPEAHRKVDPKYVASAIADRVQGKIQLFCVIGADGLVSSVEVVRGLDDRLNASAMEALGKWQFAPATREGEPVAVDVLVEIPFHLAPLIP